METAAAALEAVLEVATAALEVAMAAEALEAVRELATAAPEEEMALALPRLVATVLELALAEVAPAKELPATSQATASLARSLLRATQTTPHSGN